MTPTTPDEPVCEMCGNFPPTDLSYALANMLGNWCPSCGHPHGTGHKPASPAASPVLEPAQDAQDGGDGVAKCAHCGHAAHELYCIADGCSCAAGHTRKPPVPEAGSVKTYTAGDIFRAIEGGLHNDTQFYFAPDYDALLVRCEKAERERDELRAFKAGLPADWFVDSSLKTWFPITEMMLQDLTTDRDRLATRVGALETALRDLLYVSTKDAGAFHTAGAVTNARAALSHKDPAP